MTSKITEEEFEQVYLRAIDPKAPLKHCPVVTTLLINYCNNDHNKLIEICELIKIMINTDREINRDL